MSGPSPACSYAIDAWDPSKNGIGYLRPTTIVDAAETA
jgi:hypothetical protein